MLAQMNVGWRKMPLLVTQNYGRGRTAVHGDVGHLALADEPAAGRPGARSFLAATAALAGGGYAGADSGRARPHQTLMDDGHIQISANVRDKEYMPAADAQVTAHFIGPDGISAMVDMTPAPNNPGVSTRRGRRRSRAPTWRR